MLHMQSGSMHESRFMQEDVNFNGPLVRFVKFRVAHAPGVPGTFSTPPRVSDPDMHHGTWCMQGSLTSGFLWSRWRVTHSRHSRRMRNPQFYVSGKRPIAVTLEIGCAGSWTVISCCELDILCIKLSISKSRPLWCLCEKLFARSMLIHHPDYNSLYYVVDSSLQYSGFSPQDSFSGHSYLGPLSNE